MRVTVKETARLLGMSELAVRCGLREGVFPFGFAIKTSSKYTYHISRYKLNEYIGADTYDHQKITEY